ncbi:MAG: hypothetical protein ACRC0Y_07865, partial [Fusobacteriaceae bacterium]
DDNYQYDGDQETIKFFARTTEIFTSLKPYMKSIVKENAEKGIPVQRPMFFHYEADKRSYDIKYQYLLGKDVLVAPVYLEGVTEWDVYLPEDKWINIWTGEELGAGDHKVKAELGKIPVFYRKDSEWKNIFEAVGKL